MQELIERLRKVGSGIGLIYAALGLSILAAIIIALAPIFMVAAAGNKAAGPAKNQPRMGQNPFAPGAAQPNPGDAIKLLKGPALFLTIGGILLSLVAAVMDLIGRIFCLAVPPECAGAPYLQTALAIIGAGMAVTIWSLLGALGILVNPPVLLSGVVGLLNLVASILFMIFLRLLAEYIHRDDLASAAKSVLAFAVIILICAVGVLGTFVVGIFFPPVALLGILGVCVLIILAIALLVRYAGLLSNLRGALSAYADALGQDRLEFKPTPR
jgi:hypothetical protein